jgi:hypothetical protein
MLNYHIMIHKIKHRDICYVVEERNIEKTGKQVGC